MTNFEYGIHFFLSDHRITLEQQKMSPRISLGTFVTEKNALKYFKKLVTANFSYVCERFEAAYNSIVKNLDLQGN